MKSKRKPYTAAAAVDPYFQEVPWELVYDDKGRLIGEVYTLPRERPPKKTPGMQTSLETRHDSNQWHLGVARRKMLIEQILKKGIPGLKRRDMEQMSIDKLTELLQQGPDRRRAKK